MKDKQIQMQNRLFYNILHRPREFEVLREEINARYDVNFQEGIFQGLIINTDIPEFHAEDAMFQKKIMTVIADGFSFCHEKIAMSSMEGIFILLNYEAGRETDVEEEIYRVFSEIKQLVELFGRFRIIIGVGSGADHISGIAESIQEAKIAEKYKVIYQTEKVIRYQPQMKQRIPFHSFISTNTMKELRHMLAALDEPGLTKWFFELDEYVRSESDISPLNFYELKDNIISILLEFLEERGEESGKERLERQLMELMHHMSYGKIILTLKNIVLEQVRVLKNEEEQRENRPIRLARQYIHENLDRPLTLEEVADIAGLSSVHFRRMFKKATDKSFLEYVTDLKMEYARNLLRESTDPIAEIGRKVGYADESYFRKVFKKATGIKPSEYRRLYS